VGKATPLHDLVVADLSSGIPGAYCTKLLADAGATVIKLESPEGDALRSWSATRGTLDADQNGALFEFLACSKQSVVIDQDKPDDVAMALGLVANADAVVWSPGSRLAASPSFSPWSLRERFPALDVVTLTAFGLEGPWAGRPSTEFTLQAWAGAIGHRGFAERPPISVGGRVGEWAAGVYAALGLLASQRRSGPIGRRRAARHLDLRDHRHHLDEYAPGPFLRRSRSRTRRRAIFVGPRDPSYEGWMGRVHDRHGAAVARLLRARRTL
jgi:crotonobetainyl-CoA:carnitine CoA-transferase CaiB-like acyl-CoA transferase